VELRQVVKFRLTYGPNDEEVSAVFEGRADPLQVQVDASEVSEVRYIREQDVLESMSQRPQDFCGWFIQIMRHRAGQPVEIQIL
jgi:isopentenyldiphosphate isomerase